MSVADLDSRVAGVLQRAKASPDDVAALLAEAERALADTEQELAQANAPGLGSDVDFGGDRIGERHELRRRVPAAAFGGGAGSARREACGSRCARRA